MKASHFQGVLLSGALVLARAGAVVVKWVQHILDKTFLWELFLPQALRFDLVFGGDFPVLVLQFGSGAA